MKKFLSIVLTLILIVSAVPSGAFTFTTSALTSDGYYDSGSCGTNVTWSYNESSQTLTISGTGAMKNFDNVDYVSGRPSYYPLSQRIKHLIINEGVTQIGTDAFESLIFLQDVFIPESMRIIRSNAFASTYLKSIYNYSSLSFTKGSTSHGGIARYATFIGNYYKVSGTCGTNATWSLDSRYGTLYINGTGAMSDGCYSKWASYSDDIGRIVIQSGITTIGDEAFKNCKSASSVTIPSTVSLVGSEVFSNMTNLRSINIPNSVSSIGVGTFSGCTALSSVVLPTTLTKIEDDLFSGCTKLEEIVIPNTVEEIGENAFYDCDSLATANLPSNLEKIGNNAFYNCKSLSEITIPTGIVHIGSDAFKNCSGIKQVNITSLENWCDIDLENQYSNPLYYSRKLLLNGNVVTSLAFPETISEINSYSFIGCIDLADVAFHTGITNIGSYAFAECSNISEVTLSKELVDIGENAFDESVVIFGYTGSAAEEYANQNGNLFYSRNDTINDLISWNYNQGVLYINGIGDMPNYNLFTSTPWYEIKDYIKSVEIDERITSVGTYSFFGCDNLVAIATDNKDLTFKQYSLNTNSSLTFYGYSSGALETYCTDNQFNFVEHLSKPNIIEITPDTITVEQNVGWLYSLDKTNWSNSNLFENLTECTNYTIYVRRAKGLTPMAIRSSEGTVATTLPYPTPDIPVLSKITADTIEVVKVEGLEYSLDKETWNKTGKFTALKCLTSYRVYARPITDIVAAQKVSEPLAVTTPDYPTPKAPTLNTVTDTTISVNTMSGFEYSLDKINWTTIGIFTGLSPAQSYNVYVRPVTTISEAQKVSEPLVVTTLKLSVPSPQAPVIESYNDGTVVIEATNGYEYSNDGITWQTSSVFENITYDTLYYLYQRVAETDTQYVSESSPFTKIIIPSTPTINFVGATTISIDTKDGYEYSLDKVYWQTSGDFEKLITDLEYTVYCRPIYQTYLFQAISNGVTVTLNGKDRSETPSTPILISRTDTTVTLTFVEGYEYSKNGDVWQTSNVFENLDPLTKYEFYQRVAETSINAASKSSEALIVTTDKPVANKPSAPTLLSCGDTSVTLIKVSGYEYSKDGNTWQSSNIFTGLLPVTEYNFYQRVAETDVAYASASSSALLVLTDKSTPTKPSAPTLSTKTDTTVTLTKITGYEYKMDNGSWQSSNVFSGLSSYSMHTFYQRVAATSSSYASASSSALSVTTNKSTPAKPSAPTLSSKTATTVTLTNFVGYEYKMDDGGWQSSNYFSGLVPNSSHYFYQRVAETNTSYASLSSCALSITTFKSTPLRPSAPTLLSKTHNSITLTAKNGYEYSHDGVNWQSSNVFTDLVAETNYIFYQRSAETTTCYASETSEPLVVKTDSEPVYTIVFKNWDGKDLSIQNYHFGDKVIAPTNPTRVADTTYFYTFEGWDKTVVDCVGDATYTATYTPTYIDYTVVFKDWNGDVLSSKKYHYGDRVTTPSNPTRAADNTYTYTFAGWDSNVVACNGDKIYTATYTPNYIDYTVTFKNYDGAILSNKTYHYGDTVIAPNAPSKSADNTYTYTFVGWDSSVVACNGDKVYTALYTPNYIDYTVTFKNYDGTVLSSKTYHYGDTVIMPNTPTKPEDDEYTYTFAGWDSSVVACNGNKTYTATFDSIKKYVVGDLDGVEGVTDRDAVYLLYHTFLPNLYPVNQDCDFNGDTQVNDKDAIHLLYHTFLPSLYPLA